MQKLASVSQKIIEYSFCLLFFLVPLIFYSKNYELFEYNKMMLTYAFTIIILTAWVIKMSINKKIEIARTPFDKFLLLFLISQILSTIFSIDVHISVFGYYSRFHQGLLATFSYLILYFAFTSNFPKEKIKNIFYSSFTSALIIALWGIFEHFGHSPSCLIITHRFNVDCWVQDVQTRVFATLGQPNWMSAYLAILIPISLSMSLRAQAKQSRAGLLQSLCSFAMTIIFYTAFLFTRSRSGFVALWIGLTIFIIMSLRAQPKQSRAGLLQSLRSFAMTIAILLSLTFVFGSGIAQIDKYTLVQTPNLGVSTSTAPALESGGTESGQIRRIVWKGALDIFRHYPLFGSGVETFAFSYYQYKPVEHNLVSEWDFLYNKAHSEYLNFLATTGLFGFITYMSFIIAFIIWFIKNLRENNVIARNEVPHRLVQDEVTKQSRAGLPRSFQSLAMTSANLALFISWLTILITNFFGFSVVIVALYFYLIPAIVFLNSNSKAQFRSVATCPQSLKATAFCRRVKQFNNVAIIIIFILSFFLFYKLVNVYLADIDYASASSYAKNQKYKEAYLFLSQAIEKNPIEPIYHDEISNTLANLAVLFAENKDTETSEKFASLALKESDIATRISPNNVTFYKTKTKMFYTLSALDPSFVPRAVNSLEKAQQLAPTDAKIKYNLAVLYSKNGDLEKAISTLEEAINVKPNYKDGRYALALFYKDEGLAQKAIDQLNYILDNIDPKDTDTKEKLNSWSVL